MRPTSPPASLPAALCLALNPTRYTLSPFPLAPSFAHLFSQALCIVPSAFAFTLLAAIQACGIVAVPTSSPATPCPSSLLLCV